MYPSHNVTYQVFFSYTLNGTRYDTVTEYATAALAILRARAIVRVNNALGFGDYRVEVMSTGSDAIMFSRVR